MLEKIPRIRWYRAILQLSKFKPALHFVHTYVYRKGSIHNLEKRGAFPMTFIRRIWNYLDLKIDYGEHHYTIVREVGEIAYDITPELVYEYLKDVINRTVPFAFIGGNNMVFDKRIDEGRATAGGGGPVITKHNDQTLTMENIAVDGHFFKGGYVNIRVYEDNGKVYIEAVGGGKNNFTKFNTWFGEKLFINVLESNIAEYKKLLAEKKNK